MDIKIKVLHPDAIIPAYQTSGAAGFDLCAIENIIIPAHKSALIKTGLSMELESGYELQIRPRSGLALKHQITVLNSPGTIDWDYRGEIMIILINHSDKDFEVKKGDRIAQGIVAKVEIANFQLVEALNDSKRGEKGFGSSGVSTKE